VAASIFKAAEGGRGDVIYVRWMWRFVMTIITLSPSAFSSACACDRGVAWPLKRNIRHRAGATTLLQGRLIPVAISPLQRFAPSLALPGQTLTTKYVNDLLIFLDGAHRISWGQVPNRDFHTALGPWPYLPAAVFPDGQPRRCDAGSAPRCWS
jgi:hypothetical protein